MPRVDGLSVYAVRHASNGKWVLVAFGVQNGEERNVADLNLPPTAILSGFSLHPLGKSFVTSIGLARRDIWLLEGFDRPSRSFKDLLSRIR